MVSSAGASLLVESARVTGWGRGLRPWRERHDLCKLVRYLVVAFLMGGDCLAYLSVVRVNVGMFE